MMAMMMMISLLLLISLPLSLSLPNSRSSSSISISTARSSRIPRLHPYHHQHKLHAGFGKKEIVVSKDSSAPKDTDACACGSTKSYQDCCKQFHTFSATRPANPVELVRSRFSSLCYKNMMPYMIATTHPKVSPSFFIINPCSNQ